MANIPGWGDGDNLNCLNGCMVDPAHRKLEQEAEAKRARTPAHPAQYEKTRQALAAEVLTVLSEKARFFKLVELIRRKAKALAEQNNEELAQELLQMVEKCTKKR